MMELFDDIVPRATVLFYAWIHHESPTPFLELIHSLETFKNESILSMVQNTFHSVVNPEDKFRRIDEVKRIVRLAKERIGVALRQEKRDSVLDTVGELVLEARDQIRKLTVSVRVQVGTPRASFGYSAWHNNSLRTAGFTSY